MAYNNDGDVITELATIQKNNRGSEIHITKIEKKKTNAVYVDIREYFTSDESGDVLPTKKGIRIRDEILYDVLKSTLSVLETDELSSLIDAIHNELVDREDS